jgi:GTP-binding protein
VVFLGRSNVGKSSLINSLLGARGLARVSRQPGRTQSVNFFRVNDAFYFVDLPGYGYARVPERIRRRWASTVEGFLARFRRRIVLAIMVIDARRGLTDLDRLMRDWLEAGTIPYVAAATKADKLSGPARVAAERRLREELTASAVAPILASARTGRGIAGIWRHLDEALEGRRAHGGRRAGG